MRKRNATGAGLSVGVVLAVPSGAQAEDIQVTNLNNDGAGSLRQAIEQANADADADRVLFRSKLSGAIEWDDSDPDIYGDVEIIGPGARRVTVRAVEGGRAFVALGAPYGPPDVDATISGLTLTGGVGPSGGAI